MEYLILAAALLFVWGGIALLQTVREKKRRDWEKERLCASFGQPAAREYEPGEFQGIPRYFEKHRGSFCLDEITWRDLDLDEVFQRMNTTGSSAGQEYLYYMLKTPVFDERELLRREEQMRYFTQHRQQRVELQMRFCKMGRTGRYSLYDYLDFLDDLGERKNGKQIVLDLLLVASAALIAVHLQTGLLLLLALLTYNISTYLKQKHDIEPYLVSFRYVFRTLDLADALCRTKIPAIEEETRRLKQLSGDFRNLRRDAVFGMRSTGNSSNPLEVAADYLNMIFHFDIIGFNRMLRQVRMQAPRIDEVISLVGRIDALIAAAGYRAGLPGWCVPTFAQNTVAFTGLYHPLLADPVKNDGTLKRGILLTGSNASGKSTFLKAVALNAVLAQTIHTCCADSYRGPIFRVLTSMALRDDLKKGESYYMTEIKSIKRILDEKKTGDAAVLCCVDEVLRGTNTVERIAASTQILKSLARPGVWCFAATHDIELTTLLQQEYDNFHFEEQIVEGDIRFPYRLLPGQATTRNAILLLSVMGYEQELIKKAQAMASRFVETGKWTNGEEN